MKTLKEQIEELDRQCIALDEWRRAQGIPKKTYTPQDSDAIVSFFRDEILDAVLEGEEKERA